MWRDFYEEMGFLAGFALAMGRAMLVGLLVILGSMFIAFMVSALLYGLIVLFQS